MFNFLTSLGIEIRDETVVLACLRKTFQRIQLAGHKVIPLAGDMRERDKGLLQGIKEFLAQHRLHPHRVILGLPRSLVLLRFLELPPVSREDLDQMLPYEVERHLPFSAGEVYFAFQVLRKEEASQKVLLVAVKREILDRYVDLLDWAGLRPQVVDVTSLAACNALSYKRELNAEERWALVDLSGHNMEFNLLQGGVLQYSRMVPIPEPTSWVKQLKEEWRIAQHHGNGADHAPPSPPSQVLLSGPSARQELCSQLQQELGYPAFTPQLPLGIIPTEGKDLNVPSFITALGLALRGMARLRFQVDLLPSEGEKKPESRWLAVGITLGLLVSTLTLAVFLFYIQSRQDQENLKELNRLVAALKPRVAVVQKLDGELIALRKQLAAFHGLTGSKPSQLQILKELTTIIPSKVWLTNYLCSEGKVDIGGHADSASPLIPLLEGSPLFRNVQFDSPITKMGAEEQFRLKLDLEGWAPPKSTSNGEKKAEPRRARRGR